MEVGKRSRMKGTVKRFDETDGYGSIIPDDGSQNVIVHKHSIRSNGFQSFVGGESVEYVIAYDVFGLPTALDVTGPGGAPVHGNRRGNPVGRSVFIFEYYFSMAFAGLGTTAGEDESLFPGLKNDDVGRLILAKTLKEDVVRVSTVCKRWLIALSSRNKLLPKSQSLYIRIQADNRFTWHHVRRSRREQRLENPNFLPLPHPPINLQTPGSAFAALHRNIYMIGGKSDLGLLKNVWICDCRSGYVEVGPEMRVGREFAAAQVVGRTLYVMGGFSNDDLEKSKYWMEKLDFNSDVWEVVHCPDEVKDKVIYATCVVDSEIYAMTRKGWMVFNTMTEEWRIIDRAMIFNFRWGGRLAVASGVIYCYDFSGKIWGYIVQKDEWKELTGTLPVISSGVTIFGLYGKLCVVWEVNCRKETKIMYADIEVAEKSDGGLSGSVSWSGAIFYLAPGSVLAHSLSVYR
ncbi:hypothetical protein POM88_037704 [Heracleum sosnowskyi]|uniref:CSD domain-containing protein n=1 Tax=Heracleum sosnowskyi TaxID=360622 RepID=A0AAD8MG35_9APIA|nr:hypothetical protein POM88_037704 [Heracleum sosnowskyi]